jgi:hypothetical protein
MPNYFAGAAVLSGSLSSKFDAEFAYPARVYDSRRRGSSACAFFNIRFFSEVEKFLDKNCLLYRSLCNIVICGVPASVFCRLVLRL